MSLTPFRRILTGSAFDALPGILSGVRRGMSGRAITETLMRTGVQVNYRKHVLPAMKVAQRMEENGLYLARMRSTSTIKTSTLPYSSRMLRRKYSFRVLVKGVIGGGETTEQTIYVSTNRENLTIQDIEDEAIKLLNEYKEDYNITVSSVHVQYGQQNLME